MANNSSFSGSVTAYLPDGQGGRTPFDPDMLLLLYDVLLTYDKKYYGFALTDEGSEDSADFLSVMLALDSVYIYGTGRWSAQNTLENFNGYVYYKNDDSTLTDEQHKANVDKLMEYMENNNGIIEFEYVDEEPGIGFILQQTAVVTAKTDPISLIRSFRVSVDTDEESDFNIRGYADMVEGTTAETYRTTLENIMSRLDIPISKYIIFENFIIDNAYDESLIPFTDYCDQDDEGTYYFDLPEGLEEAWAKHVQ